MGMLCVLWPAYKIQSGCRINTRAHLSYIQLFQGKQDMKDFFGQGLKVHNAILHDVTSVGFRSAYETEQASPLLQCFCNCNCGSVMAEMPTVGE